MQVVTPEFVKGKKVLLRYDIDVALSDVRDQKSEVRIKEDFKLKAGLPTLKLCLENASKVIIIGHLGRGNSPEFSAKPIQKWFEKELGIEVAFAENLEQAAESNSKLTLLENIRFFHGEVEGDIDFAQRLASLGEVYVNEAFSAYHPAASTTMVPTLMSHSAGLHFIEEVKVLTGVRNPPAGGPKKPLVAIMGGVKVADKLPVIEVLAKKVDVILVGGKLAAEIREQNLNLPKNVMIGKLNEDGLDIALETVEAWKGLISNAAMIVWNGPLGKFEDPKNDATCKVVRMILDSGAEVVMGGGDSVAALNQCGLLKEAEEKGFVSVGGGAMLKFLAEGTLPTIEAL
ncbi:MAG: phosphoglycerate kinase [bacterium]|nr:phosphoglycerate kinase [bacterium]